MYNHLKNNEKFNREMKIIFQIRLSLLYSLYYSIDILETLDYLYIY